MGAERGLLAPGPVAAGAVASTALALLALLLAAALASYFVGEGTDAVIIAVIVGLSVGSGSSTSTGPRRPLKPCTTRSTIETVVIRDGHPARVDVTDLVPGDVVDLRLGDVVPADIRLLGVSGLECDESVLTGESLPVDKSSDRCRRGQHWPSCPAAR